MKKFKQLLLLATLLATTTYGITAFAATYGNDAHGVKNTEHFQLYYIGEAWTNQRGNSTWIKYYRNGSFIGSAVAYKDNWRTDAGKVYDSVTIWDSMNPWAPKTTFTYKL